MLWDKDAEAAGWVWGALGAASVWIRLGGDSWRGSCCQFFEGAVFAQRAAAVRCLSEVGTSSGASPVSRPPPCLQGCPWACWEVQNVVV